MQYFREAICGKINSEVKDSQILTPDFDTTKDTADAVQTTQK
ncbi:hypothetical protein [Clostridium tyrobutyricum]|nr:hypothetical protein [Clostridium tyrobutyricum]